LMKKTLTNSANSNSLIPTLKSKIPNLKFYLWNFKTPASQYKTYCYANPILPSCGTSGF
jgi:hypothetical protein